MVVEVKLWRNPEARRKVVAQTLEYATALFKPQLRRTGSRHQKGGLQRSRAPGTTLQLGRRGGCPIRERVRGPSFAQSARRADRRVDRRRCDPPRSRRTSGRAPGPCEFPLHVRSRRDASVHATPPGFRQRIRRNATNTREDRRRATVHYTHRGRPCCSTSTTARTRRMRGSHRDDQPSRRSSSSRR